MNRLNDKVIIVTGSTSGIGIGIAKLCAKEAAHVVITGRNVERGQKVVDDIIKDSGDAWFHSFDLTSREAMHSLIVGLAGLYIFVGTSSNFSSSFGISFSF